MSRLVLLLGLWGMVATAAEPEPQAWYPMESPTTANLRAIDFSPDGTGWAVGTGGTVLRYDGTRWQPIPGPSGSPSLFRLASLGPEELWASEGNNSILHHYRQGRWSTVQLEGRSLFFLEFLTPRLGYAAGLFGMLYRYDGTSWSRVHTPALVGDRESHLDGIALLAPDDVWVGSTTGFVLHFDGQQWHRLHPRAAKSGGRLRRLGDTVALVDAPILVRRSDAWEPLANVPVDELVSYKGTAWAILGAKLGRVAPGKEELMASMRYVWGLAVGPDGVWAVGEKGLILHLEPKRLPTFVDRTFEAGVGVLAASTSAVLADLDGQGEADLVLAAPFGRHSFLRAEAPGEFRSQQLAQTRAEDLPQAISLAVADLDGDGRVDLVLRPPGGPGVKPLRVLRNLGDWRFLEAGADSPPVPIEDASGEGYVHVADLDGDGDLDVYETRYVDSWGRQVPNVLWRNDGLGRLSPQQLAHHDGGASLDWSHSALLADLDEDGRTDVLSLNSWGQGNSFYRSSAQGALVNATRGSGLQGVFQIPNMAVAGDLDGDGAQEVLVLTAGPDIGPSRLYRRDGHGAFRDVTSALGLDTHFTFASQAGLGDVDLDGDLDLALCRVLRTDPAWAEATRLQLLLNDGQGHFTDVTPQTGMGMTASQVLLEDFDGDGDLDLYLVRPGESNRLMINEPPPNGWLKVRLEGAPPNRAALGAKVKVYGPGNVLLGMRETGWL